MNPVVSRVDSFTAADLPPEQPPAPLPELKTKPASVPVRAAKAIPHLAVMKALASRARLMAVELCLDGSVFTAGDLETPLRLTARRAADHLRILCRVGILIARTGADRRSTEYVINLAFVRRAADGTAILDFGTG